MTAHLTRRAFGAAALAAGAMGRIGVARAQERPRAGGALVATWGGPDGNGGEPATLWRPDGGGPGMALLSSKIFERLARRGIDSGAFIGVLAESWRSAADYKSYVIRLRRGVVFHDGREMTADDVVFSIGEIWKKHAQPEAMVDVTKVEATAADTVVVHYGRTVPPFAFASLLTHSAAYIVPKHAHSADIPIGTGPFRFKEWVRGSHVEFARNERYWQKGLPYLDALAIRFIRDPAGRAATLEAGEVQLGVFNALPPVEAKRLGATGKFVVTPRGYEDPVWTTTLECNTRREIPARREVRQAIFHGINRAFIARSIFHGQARPGTGPILSSNKAFYGGDVPRLDFNRGKAEELLDVAGHPKGNDGRRFTLELVAAGWLPDNAKVGAYLKQALGEIGVAINLTVTDRPGALQRLYTDYDFDLAVSNQANPAEPVPWTTQYYASGGIAKGLPFRNASGYANPGLDALVERIKVETDVLKRRDLVGEFERIVCEDAPLLPLVEHAPVTIASGRVQNHSNDPNFLAASWADLWLAGDP